MLAMSMGGSMPNAELLGNLGMLNNPGEPPLRPGEPVH